MDDTGAGNSVALCMEAAVNAEMRHTYPIPPHRCVVHSHPMSPSLSLSPSHPTHTLTITPPSPSPHHLRHAHGKVSTTHPYPPPPLRYGYAMTYPHGVTANAGDAGHVLYADLVNIFTALSAVVNNARGSVGGGGVPRVPRKPPICGAPSPM